MGSLFKPKTKMPPMQQVPTIDDARQNVEMRDRMARRRGRKSTILTGSLGDTSDPSVFIKKLLG